MGAGTELRNSEVTLLVQVIARAVCRFVLRGGQIRASRGRAIFKETQLSASSCDCAQRLLNLRLFNRPG